MRVRRIVVQAFCLSATACSSTKSSGDGGGVDAAASDAGAERAPDGAIACDEFAFVYVHAVNALAEGRNGCTVDADCFSVLDTAVACGDVHVSACPVSVTVGNEDAVQAGVDALRAEACDGRVTGECWAGPTCGFVATCAEGTCNLL